MNKKTGKLIDELKDLPFLPDKFQTLDDIPEPYRSRQIKEQRKEEFKKVLPYMIYVGIILILHTILFIIDSKIALIILFPGYPVMFVFTIICAVLECPDVDEYTGWNIFTFIFLATFVVVVISKCSGD
jgi:hypothetical protein